MKTQTPSDFCKLWLKQNDPVEREADQKAFDVLPISMRKIVNDAPVQIACPYLVQGVRKFGIEIMETELRARLDDWLRSFSGVR